MERTSITMPIILIFSHVLHLHFLLIIFSNYDLNRVELIPDVEAALAILNEA